MLSHILFTANEVITQNYSPSHQAIDVVGAGNTVSDVVAYEDGTVVLVVNNVTKNNTNTTGTATYGNFIKIKHDNNIQTLYAHLKYGSVKVKKGDYVKKGQVIGTMGNTGRAFGVHLHFEVRDYNNNRKNPYDYLWKTSKSPVLTSTQNKIESSPKEEVKVENNAVIENTQKEDSDINEKEENTDNTTNESKDTIKENNNEEITDNKEVTEDNKEDIVNGEEVVQENPIIKEEPIDSNLNKDFTLFENSAYKYMFLSDALNEIYVNNNYEYREKLALKNGINNYTGSKVQNLKLLQLLKDGKLKAVY